jgi:hypothetical protein
MEFQRGEMTVNGWPLTLCDFSPVSLHFGQSVKVLRNPTVWLPGAGTLIQ